MKCDICGSETDRLTLVMGEASACSEDCIQIAEGRKKARYAKMKSEAVEEMPELLEMCDFEQWALKLAIHYLDAIPNDLRKKLHHNNPILLNPEFLALELKDQILNHVPKAYFSEAKTRGHAAMFHNSEYMFRQPVPKQVILNATVKAEILKSNE